MDNITHLLFPAVFCAVGFLLLALMIGMAFKQHESRSWPGAPGRITASSVHGGWTGGSNNMWIEEPRISYTYSVDGQEHTGNQISIVESNTASREMAEAKIVPYPVDREVTVFYNPRKPSEAILEKKSSAVVLALMGIVGAIVLTAGILMLTGVIHLK